MPGLTDEFEARYPTKNRLELTPYEVGYLLPMIRSEVEKLKNYMDNLPSKTGVPFGIAETGYDTVKALYDKFQAFHQANKRKGA